MKARRQRGPLARSDDLLVEKIGAEIVIYDGAGKQAHCLSPVAAAVFELSDGQRSLGALTREAGDRLGETVDGSQIEQAIAELAELELLETAGSESVISRRQMMGRTAKLGTAVIGASLITTLSVPSASAAVSCGRICQNNADCTNVACPVCKKATGSSADKTCLPA